MKDFQLDDYLGGVGSERFPVGSSSIAFDADVSSLRSRASRADASQLAALGVDAAGPSPVSIYLTDADKRVGSLRITCSRESAVVIIDNARGPGFVNGNISLNQDCLCVISKPTFGVLTLGLVVMRSRGQVFYVGRDSTAVSLYVEIEGEERGIYIGDDALISSGVWIRNHGMHSVVGWPEGHLLSEDAADVVIEPHVWIGQDALLISPKRVGGGSIIGAKALVRSEVPRLTVVGGVPARSIKSGVSWGREIGGMSEGEKDLLKRVLARS